MAHDLPPPNDVAMLTPREQMLALVQRIAHAHKLTLDELLMPDTEPGARARSRVAARHEAMYELGLAYPNLSTTRIGKLFNRDHTAVIAARRRHVRRMQMAKR